MDTQTTPFNLLADLEARHDDLLLQLEQLDKRVEETLARLSETKPEAIAE